MKMILGAAALLLVAGCGGGNGNSGAAATPEGEKGPPLKVSAAEISKAFQKNEAKAKLTYDGHVLEITGKVKDIDLDIGDSPVIRLRGSGDTMGMGINQDGKITDVAINGLTKEDAAKIDKGQTLTFTCGSADEAMGGPQLSDCKVKV